MKFILLNLINITKNWRNSQKKIRISLKKRLDLYLLILMNILNKKYKDQKVNLK